MTQSIEDRIKSARKKVKRETELYKEMAKDLNVITKWVKTYPTKKEIRVPYMGLVNVKDQVKFAKQKVSLQKKEVDRHEQKLKRLSSMLKNRK